MTIMQSDSPGDLGPTAERSIETWTWVVMVLVLSAGLLSLLLLLAKDPYYWPAYLVSAVLGPSWVYLGYLLFRQNSDLFLRRSKAGEGVLAWDKFLVRLIKLGAWGSFVAGGLQARPFNPPLWALGLGLYALGWWVLAQSQSCNPYFESMVRLQEEVGHQVVDQGLYAKVRHPGYLGFLLCLASVPLMLNSPWGWLGVLWMLMFLVFRLLREETFLRQRLAGYGDYCQRVRYRLLPLIW